MKVVQVLLRPQIGGAETLAAALEAEWTLRGVDSEIVYVEPAGARSRVERIRRLRRQVRRGSGVDAVVAHSALPALYARLVAGRVPVVSVLHSAVDDHADGRLRAAEHLLRPRTAAVVAVSESQAQRYIRHFGARVPVSVIPNGVRLPAVREGTARQPIIITVARVARQKNPGFWLEVTRLARPRVSMDFEWWGPVVEEDLRTVTGATGPNARFRGPTDAPFAVLRGASLYFHPGNREAHSIGIIEAAAAGLPIVCSRSIASQLPGELVAASFDDDDPAEAVDRLEHVISQLDEFRRRADATSARVREEYSMTACAEAYLAVLRGVSAAEDTRT